jgi:hypothetical protein
MNQPAVSSTDQPAQSPAPADAIPSTSSWRKTLLFFAAVLGIPLALLILAYAYSALTTSRQLHATAVGLSYARGYMSWSYGPTVQSARIIPLKQLESALRTSVPTTVRQDVDVPGLVRHYGANRQVDLVVLSGTYNSLPPDEGVMVTGDVVELVDARTNKVLLLTD